tara:strand:+ start:1997 stop:2707 length:711 start_codon:yes stop_codon:yes gene_type:complete
MPICDDYETPAINAGFEGPCDYGFGEDFDLQAAINTIQQPGLSGISDMYSAFGEQLNLGQDVDMPSFMDWYYQAGSSMPAYGDWRRRQNMASRLGTQKLYEERIKGLQDYKPQGSGFESDYFGGRQDLLDEMQQSTSGIIGEATDQVFDIGGEYVDILNTTFGQYDFSGDDAGTWNSLTNQEQWDFLNDEITSYQESDPGMFDDAALNMYNECLEGQYGNVEGNIYCAEVLLGIGG